MCIDRKKKRKRGKECVHTSRHANMHSNMQNACSHSARCAHILSRMCAHRGKKRKRERMCAHQREVCTHSF